MSAKGIETVLAKAMSDSVFTDLLFSDVEKAVAGFDLTSEEIASLKAMTRVEFDKLISTSAEERKSFVSFGGGWDANHNETSQI